MVGNQLPRRRYDFIAALYAAGLTHPNMAAELRPERVGLQPYVTTEVYQRLKAAMREYRGLSAQGKDTKPVEQATIFYMGWLGHYVGDGSQPLHVTTSYDGWVGKENPNGYATQHGIHSKFESTFVAANIKPADVVTLMTAAREMSDVFDDYVAYLRSSSRLIERDLSTGRKLEAALDCVGTAENSKQLKAERRAAAASELRDIYYTAWMESAKPVPEWHDTPKAPTAGVKPSAGL